MNFLSDFTPTVRSAVAKKNDSKTGVIAGVVVGIAVLGLVVLAGIFLWRRRQKRRKLSLEQEGMEYAQDQIVF